MTEKTWNELVEDAARALRQRREADRDAFFASLDLIHDPRAERDGETLDHDGTTAVKLFHGVKLFSVTVRDGAYRVDGAHEISFAEREAARQHMAQLMAAAYVEPRSEGAAP
jgi:hypothetical protein